MENIKLRVIPEPEPKTRAVIKPSENFGEGALFRGHEQNGRSFVCGNCELPLIENVGDNIQFSNLVIGCPKCKAFNEI